MPMHVPQRRVCLYPRRDFDTAARSFRGILPVRQGQGNRLFLSFRSALRAVEFGYIFETCDQIRFETLFLAVLTEQSRNTPVLFWDKSANLGLSITDQSQCNRLDAPGACA